MAPSREAHLRSLFPALYGNAKIEVGDGWFDLLVDTGITLCLFAKRKGVEVHCLAAQRTGAKLWLRGVHVLGDETLTARVRAITEHAELKSLCVCEKCGVKYRGVLSCDRCESFN
jgi:hypothetical protein